MIQNPTNSTKRIGLVSAITAVTGLLLLSILSQPHEAARTEPASVTAAQLPGDVFAGGYPVTNVPPPNMPVQPSMPPTYQINEDRIDVDEGSVRLSGTAPAALAYATTLKPGHKNDSLTLTIVLNRDDQEGFDSFLRQTQDSKSSLFRRYLTPREQADRFGPSERTYDDVRAWLRRKGFSMVESSANRLTLTVSGTRQRAEKAFSVRTEAQADEQRFSANDRRPGVPAKLASHIQAVIGLTDLPKPHTVGGDARLDPAAPKAAESDQVVLSNCVISARNSLNVDPEFLHCDLITRLEECNLIYHRKYSRYLKACFVSKGIFPNRNGNGHDGSGSGPSSSNSKGSGAKRNTSLDLASSIGLSNSTSRRQEKAVFAHAVKPRASIEEEEDLKSLCSAAASLAGDNDPAYRDCLFQPQKITDGECSFRYKLARNHAYITCLESKGKKTSEENGPNGPSPGAGPNTSRDLPTLAGLSNSTSRWQGEPAFTNPVRPRPSIEAENLKSFCTSAASVAADNDPIYRACLKGDPGFRTDGLCQAIYKGQWAQYNLYCIKSKGKKVSEDNGPNGPTDPRFGTNTGAGRQPSADPSTAQSWLAIDGTGQTVGLLEFDTFNKNDIKDYLALAGYPASEINHLSQVHVNGGAQLGPEESEVLIDIIAVMSNARGANVVVYDAPFNGIRTSFQTLFNRMISDGVNVISNSWVYCEDQTSAADAQSIDSILASAAAAGITVLNSTGDFGSACVNGSGNTISVPADSPHATAVGGTSLTTGPALTYGSELFWNSLGNTPPGGAGGFGVSRFFSRPTYQNGFNSSPWRSVPDVSVNGDPSKGIEICQADAGGCPTGASYGGTSLSAPIWAAFVALLNQAQGQNLGELNPLLYPLGNSNAFHSPSSMGSDFQHVGLGSPNLNLIHRALANKTAGPVSATVSEVAADPAGAAADGNAEVFVVVRLRDADGHTVSGKTVTLTANSGTHATVTTASSVSNVANGAVVFSIKDAVAEFVTFTATDTTDSVVLQTQVEVVFVAPPATAGGISATPTTVNANASDSTIITVTLQDAKGNPSAGKVVNLSQGNGASVISATTATTDATGKVQFTAVSAKAETVTYTATDVTDRNLPVPGSATVNFVNASGFCAGTNSFRFGTAAPGFAVTTFAGNFPLDCFTSIGPVGLAFDQNGTLLVGDFQNNNLYAFGQQGGTASPATLVGQVPPQFGLSLSGMAFTKDGHFFGMLANGNNLVEVNPTDGSVIRTVAHLGGLPKFGLAVDPLSGDLFVSSDDGISRVSNFANGPGTVALYSNGTFDGLTFATDGTLYAANESAGGIFRINATNAPTPGTATQIAVLAGHPDGIAIEPNPANASKPFLYANRNDGTITRIDTSLLPNTIETPCVNGCTDIYAGGSRGDFVTVGPSGCLYATQSDRIIRITKADGTCSLTPTNPAPQISLTPENVQPSPAQGNTVTFTAQIKNAANAADIPVTLLVSGANPTGRLVRTDATGKATITYKGIFTGADTALASANVGGATIFSNDSTVTWTAGKHNTFLTLNLSPASGDPHKPLALAATLVDVSATPTAATLVGETVSFTIAGQTCSGTTDATGTARCSITTNSAAGTFALSASFAGTNSLLSSTAIKTVDLMDTPPPPSTTVQFDSANYSVAEACTSLTINVTRTGDTSAASSVDFSTSDGTASERTDYTTGLGTVRFAPGETQKSFSLLVNGDSFAEGDETFNVTLSNVQGGGFGAPSTAVVTIVDAGARSGNLNDDSRQFVCQHYHDFLNRQSDQSGEDFWTQNIEQCSTNALCRQVFRVETSAAFFLSVEFKETGYFVIRSHKAAFGSSKTIPRYQPFIGDQRVINEGVVVGQGDWQQKIESNKQTYLADFTSRPEFVVLFPQGMAAAAYVDKLFANAGAIPTTAERGAAINAYGPGDAVGRSAALRTVVESGSVFNAEYNAAFVLMQYFGYLRRDPNAAPDKDFAGYDFWLAKLNSVSLPGEDMRDDAQALARVRKAEMVRAFIESLEFRKRFGPP